MNWATRGRWSLLSWRIDDTLTCCAGGIWRRNDVFLMRYKSLKHHSLRECRYLRVERAKRKPLVQFVYYFSWRMLIARTHHYVLCQMHTLLIQHHYTYMQTSPKSSIFVSSNNSNQRSVQITISTVVSCIREFGTLAAWWKSHEHIWTWNTKIRRAVKWFDERSNVLHRARRQQVNNYSAHWWTQLIATVVRLIARLTAAD